MLNPIDAHCNACRHEADRSCAWRDGVQHVIGIDLPGKTRGQAPE
jgi:hypothetical protein